jgi:hypothetical protein
MNSVLLRTAIGFLLAPISPGLLILILGIVFGFGKPSEGIWIIKLSALLGYPIAIVFGVPLYFLFRSRGWNGLLTYITTGALLGIVIYLIYIPLGGYSSNGLLGLSERFSDTALVYIPLGMICGAVAALSFWLIARPNHQTP